MSTVLLPLTSASAACCAASGPAALSADGAADLARTLKAVADPARLRLLSIVAAHDDQEACVCDLTEPVGLSQATGSYHLKMLTDAGFLSRSKRGTWAYYRLVPGALDAAGAALGSLAL
jgi:ArsR family transcriptional regulator